ncbi:hypothetical protein H9P43_000102 [Blastocladiella emersonii ATCC 22665]|nr:hypothetical protein H9P43_000102 [Blastocladiella emersonii ATCC 22665]
MNEPQPGSWASRAASSGGRSRRQTAASSVSSPSSASATPVNALSSSSASSTPTPTPGKVAFNPVPLGATGPGPAPAPVPPRSRSARASPAASPRTTSANNALFSATAASAAGPAAYPYASVVPPVALPPSRMGSYSAADAAASAANGAGTNGDDAGSETDEDWDLANATDDEDTGAHSDADAAASLPPSRRSLSGYYEAAASAAMAAASVRQFSQGMLAALTALPVGEAWRLVRARVALDRHAHRIDPLRLYSASLELADVLEAGPPAPLPTRLLAQFLLFALYADPSLPVLPLDVSQQRQRRHRATPPPRRRRGLLAQFPPLLSDAAEAYVLHLPESQRHALALARAHPFLALFLRLARHGAPLEQTLAHLLLFSPRRPRSAPHLLSDQDFLAKTMVHIAAYSDTLEAFIDRSATSADPPDVALPLELCVLAETVEAIDAVVAEQRLVGDKFTALLDTEWKYTDAPSAATAALADWSRARAAADMGLQPPEPGGLGGAESSADAAASRPATPTVEGLTESEVASLTAALERAASSPMDALPAPLPASLPASLLSPATVQGLITHSPDLAADILARTTPLDALADVLLRPTHPLRVAHLQVVHRLWASGALAKDHLPAFVSRVVSSALASGTARTVQLATKFLSKYVADLPPESLVEVRNFCADHLLFKDVSDLFRQVSALTGGTGLVEDPAQVEQPPALTTAGSTSSASSGGGSSSGAKRRKGRR